MKCCIVFGKPKVHYGNPEVHFRKSEVYYGKLCFKWTIWWLLKYIWAVTWDFHQCGMCNQQSFRLACAYTQLIRAFASRLNVIPLLSYWLKHHLEFLSLKGGCTGSSESTLVKMPHCWKSHAAAPLRWIVRFFLLCLKVIFHIWPVIWAEIFNSISDI